MAMWRSTINNQHVSIDTGMIKTTGPKQERLGSTPRKSCCQGKAFTIPGFAKDQDSCLDSLTIQTLPKAQRTRGLSSSFQNNFLKSYLQKQEQFHSDLHLTLRIVHRPKPFLSKPTQSWSDGLVVGWEVTNIPHICHERHEYIRVNFFWSV